MKRLLIRLFSICFYRALARIYANLAMPKKVGQDGIGFSLQLNNWKACVAAAETLCAQVKSRAKLGEYNNTNCSRLYSDEECVLTFCSYAAKII